MIKPHQILLLTGYGCSIVAYQESVTGSLETIEGYTIHSRLLAMSYLLVIWAFHRVESNPLTRFITNVIQGACIANLFDEFYGDPIVQNNYELIVFGMIFIISLILFIRKQPKYYLWLRKYKKS